MIPLSIFVWPFRSMRNALITLVLVVVFILWSSLQAQANQQHAQDLYNQGWRDNGTNLTDQQCRAQGGTIDGNFCLVP